MNDDEWDERLSKAARSYHQPPETPKEEIWAGIRARRKRRSVLRPPQVIWWSVGVAALLVIGIGIGRLTVKPQPTNPAPELATRPPSRQTAAMAVAAVQHLSRVEALLTGFRAEGNAAGSDANFSASARDLLSNTRLLLDSPELTDPQMRGLLEDLELVLVQITQLSAGHGHGEVDLITEGLKQRGLLPRLRSAIPAGPAVTRAQGEI
ncbi:MAG TPA: hypothetical protein VLB12_14155 [Gemmatimonadales bacterium]|nr:hypothetical protein [Gemmatimonadales bacterium]